MIQYPNTLEPIDRRSSYDCGRVRYFYDQLQDGVVLDPIEIDNLCANGRIYADPVLIDGHHRFWAALLANVERIPVSYSGRMDVLRYLQGKRKTPPQ